ncbi:c-type cytochrome [Rufibacter latericius]|uniref:Cytochrome c class I n=1 Tax=Rufibacter latericius TaxID=2487040 RepID=A0A3M9N1H6_9BACT|nr:c-type cytochrome [Rufibacter latericius]RNI31651.1 cytochrome c class I [Rufibacter latericius]
MKKVFLLLSCCAFMAACNSNSGTTNEGSVASTDADSASSAAMSAANRQSDADTTSQNIGTDRTAGGGANPHENGAKLIAQSDCTGCHKIDQKLVGPAYEAVAEKYENNDKDTDYLAGKIIQGGKGVWGEIPMTPHPNLSQEDAKQMAQYILSLKK